MTEPLKPRKICPIRLIECTREECPAWMKLDDFEGCSFDFSLKAVKEIVLDGARFLDDLGLGDIFKRRH